ncbi:MAG: hypothetical protein CMJ78_06870 [Planctomycetaceae bacterium]|nr:hypothetical protein [Planctomycetaceae bacterium]
MQTHRFWQETRVSMLRGEDSIPLPRLPVTNEVKARAAWQEVQLPKMCSKNSIRAGRKSPSKNGATECRGVFK